MISSMIVVAGGIVMAYGIGILLILSPFILMLLFLGICAIPSFISGLCGLAGKCIDWAFAVAIGRPLVWIWNRMMGVTPR